MEKVIEQLEILIQNEETQKQFEQKNPPALPLQWNGKTGGFLNFFIKFRQNRQPALLYRITKAPKPLISTVSVNMVAGRDLSSRPPGCEAGKGCFAASLRLIITKTS